MGCLNIVDLMRDPELLGSAFADSSWNPWFTVLRAVFGISPEGNDAVLYGECTGRDAWPTAPAREAWLVVGRRGGKSRIAALVGVFVACFRDYSNTLAPGERGTLPIISADRKQSRTIMRYLNGLFDASPLLQQMVTRRTADSIELSNDVTLEVHTANFRSVRGYTLVGCIFDEISFFRSDDSANADHEIVAAVLPAMVTVPGALLLAISSPYSRTGIVWERYRRYFGKDDSDVLVWQAPTRTMNASVPQSFIDRAVQDDPASASSEYLALFRQDIDTFISREVVDACVAAGRFELPPVSEIAYTAFIDAAGGSGSDAFTCGVAHAEERDGERVVVLDAVHEIRPPFSPDKAVQEVAALLKRYHIHSATSDKFAAQFAVEAFSRNGVAVEQSAEPKSSLYAELLPLLNSGRVELLDNPRLIAQLCGLERRTSRAGKDSIDHGYGSHDDVINSACGALVAAAESSQGYIMATGLSATPVRVGLGSEMTYEMEALIEEREAARREMIEVFGHDRRRDWWR